MAMPAIATSVMTLRPELTVVQDPGFLRLVLRPVFQGIAIGEPVQEAQEDRATETDDGIERQREKEGVTGHGDGQRGPDRQPG